MFLPFPFRRLHLAEIDDQPWFPSTLRSYVQAVLTNFWTIRLETLQDSCPATLAAQKLQSVLKDDIRSYTFVDFCSGAGGPTPHIEHEVNASLRAEGSQRHAQLNGSATSAGVVEESEDEGADFIMTDLFPHTEAWKEACAASESGRLMYLYAPLDASTATKEVLSLATGRRKDGGKSRIEEQKMFRLFSLAFHHFDDDLAIKMLRNTFLTSDGFAIFELQARDMGNFITVLLLWPALMLGSWYWFWGDWGHLFWTYVIPVVPFVTVYDGLISCLRTRREKEVVSLIEEATKGLDGGAEGWKFEVGEVVHTWPIGTMNYFIGVQRGS